MSWEYLLNQLYLTTPIQPQKVMLTRRVSLVKTLAASFNELTCFPDQEVRSYGRGHYDCAFTSSLQKEVNYIADAKEPSGVLDSHREHMEEQSKK